MLSVLLLILKIIGIVLASALGVVLLLLLLILFSPIRYKVLLEKDEDPSSDFNIKVTFDYLFHIINGRYLRPGDGFRLRVFIFKIIPKKEKPEKTEKPIKEKKVKTKDIKNSEVPDAYENKDSNENVDEVEIPSPNENESRDTSKQQDEDASEDQKPSLKALTTKLLSIFKNIKLTLTKTYDKIIDIRDNITYYIDIIESDRFKKAFNLAKKEIIRVLKAILPRKIRANVTFGADDPSTVGQVLSYYSLIYPYVGKKIILNPDFENKKLYGSGYLKGHTTLFVLLVSVLKLYYSKNINTVIKQFKKEK